jgi:putative ABC transport system permease protein
MSEKLVPFLMKQPMSHLRQARWVTSGWFDVLTGIDLGQFNRLSGGFHFFRGGPFENDDDVPVDEYYAREKNLDTGSTITLANHAWRVSGNLESGKLSHICARLNVLQALTGNPGRFSQIYLKVDDAARAQLVVDRLRGKMPGYFIYTMEELTLLLTIIAFVGFIVVTMAM